MGVMIDISIGQHGGLCTLDFMNFVDQNLVKQDHLLKKSIMLLKSWMTYESSLLGSQLACMATYGLYTLVIYVFNNYGLRDGQLQFKNEIQFFNKFFEIFGEFDWDKYMITIYGPVRRHNFQNKLRDECLFDMNRLALNERAAYFGFENQENSLDQLMIKPHDVQPLIDKYSALRILSTCLSSSSENENSQ